MSGRKSKALFKLRPGLIFLTNIQKRYAVFEVMIYIIRIKLKGFDEIFQSLFLVSLAKTQGYAQEFRLLGYLAMPSSQNMIGAVMIGIDGDGLIGLSDRKSVV